MAKMDSLFPEEIRPEKGGSQSPRSGQRRAPQRGGAPARGAPPNRGNFPQNPGPQERTPVKDLSAGQEVQGVYLVQDASLRAAKNGSKYVSGTFADKTGSIPVRHWDANDALFAIYSPGNYALVRGRVETYQNKLQMVAFQVQSVEADQVDAGEFLAVSTRDQAVMEKEFDELLASISDPDYKRLLDSIFADPEVRASYLKGPAAASVHHAWLGGLLEHVLSASKTAHQIAVDRPFLDRDLLVAGVILHDIGKIEELDSGPGFRYTDTGQLLGHIVLGTLLVEKHILKLGEFPKKKRDKILHMILSHHGTREFGSPVTPRFAEALALHHLECMDAKVQGFQTLIERDQDAGNDGSWTDFARVADGRIYKG